MRLAVLVLALAPLATTRAEVVHILEDFSDAQRFFTDAGASLGPGFWDSGAMNATTTEEGALRVDYETWWAQLYGYVQFGRILDDYYPCADATHLSLRYRVTQPQTPAQAARMGVVLLDGSDCAGPACSALAAPGWTFENYIGLRSLASDDQVLLEALDVFGGAMTCCRLGHASGAPCDREALMLPMLGLYAELYRDRRGASAEAYALIEDKKDKLYPRTFAYRCRGTDGAAPTTEELPLFGDLIDAVDSCAEINERPS